MNSKHPVLILIPSFSIGGAEKVINTIIHHLPIHIFDLHVCTIYKTTHFFECPNHIHLYEINSNRLISALPSVLKIINQKPFKLVLSCLAHLNMGLLLLKPFLKYKPKIVIREGSVIQENLKNEPYPVLMHYLYKKLYKKADRIICQSDYMQNELTTLFNIPVTKCKVIYNPVNFNNEKTENPYKHKKHLNLLCVGRLDLVKQFSKAIEQLQQWVVQEKSIHLTIIGDGPLKKPLSNLTKKLHIEPYVTFTGPLKDIQAYYQYANGFICCSLYEGLPNVLLEAISNKTPIFVLKHKGGAKEVLEKCGLSNAYHTHFPTLEKAFQPITESSYQAAKSLLSLDKIVEEYSTTIETTIG